MMNDQLERGIRRALADIVAAAPAALDEPHDGAVTVESRAATGLPWLRVAAGFLALGALGVVAALVLGSREQPPVADAPPATGWRPPGDEFPLEDLGVPDASIVLTTDLLSRALGVEGHPSLVATTSLTYAGGQTAELQRCLWQGGSGGCTPEWNPIGLSIGITSSIDNGVAAYDLWTWDNVPANAAFVTYVDGPEMRWQRPIAGVAMFPNVEGDDEVVIAHSADGTELGRVDRATLAAQRLTGPNQLADISQEQLAELQELTDTTLRECLLDRGAALASENVATIPSISVWDECVRFVKQDVADRVKALNVDFYDPTTEGPSNPNPDPGSATALGEDGGSIIINVTMPED